jgi:hypothetical protein
MRQMSRCMTDMVVVDIISRTVEVSWEEAP